MAGKRKYKVVQCFTTKGAANKKKKAMHKAGKTATVRKKVGGSGYCVASAGKRKKAKK